MSRFRGFLKKIAGYVIDRSYNNPSAERARMLKLAFLYTRDEKVEGDYLEFGVHRGRTFIYALKTARQLSIEQIHFYAFDSFNGLPQIDGVDAIFERFSEGQVKCDRETFEYNLRKCNVDMSKVIIVPGWYDQTLTKETREKIAIKSARIVYIDCDLYKSTKSVLWFIRPLISNGTVLLFDDWFCYRADPKKGEQRATEEWLTQNPGISLIEWRKFAIVGQSFIVNIQK